MREKIMRGVWSAGVLAGLAAGILAAASTPTAVFAQAEVVCYQECHCNEFRCICSLIGCGEP